MKMNYPILSLNIRYIRRRRDMTRDELADKIGVRPVRVQKIECGEPPTDEELVRICEALAVTEALLRTENLDFAAKTSCKFRHPRL